MVPSLVRWLGRGLALVHVQVGPDSLIAEGMDGHEVEQLMCCPQLVASKLMDKRFIGGTEDECFDYICFNDIEELIALLGEVADVLSESLPSL